ncbi:MAG: glucosamine-6-phosphate deaminase [Chthoniobacterales bacterium]
MEVIIQPTSETAAVIGAKIIATLIRNKPDAVLGLATGSTPLPLYGELIRMHKEEGLDFSRITTFNLDEYVGLEASHPASYHHFMQENFFRHVNISPSRTFLPDGLKKDIPAHCKEYEEMILAAGGIDLQILGIGTDGHIGFNEPTSSLASRTRIKTLTQHTRQDNARFFNSVDDVPHHVITMGVGTIMEAGIVLLLAFGKQKAAAVSGAVEGPITALVPASILQMHPQAKALIDEEASQKLQRCDYYKWVYANKPEWQKI